MRHLLAGIVVMSWVAAGTAGELLPEFLSVGQSGTIDQTATSREVVRVLDEKSLLVNLYKSSPRVDVVVKVASTKDVADGTKLDMPGAWKVTGTQKVGTKTYFVLEKGK